MWYLVDVCVGMCVFFCGGMSDAMDQTRFRLRNPTEILSRIEDFFRLDMPVGFLSRFFLSRKGAFSTV